MNLSKLELENLAKELPRGTQSKIAKMLNVSRQHVSEVFRGESQNIQVIEIAIDIRDERRKITTILKKRINKKVKS